MTTAAPVKTSKLRIGMGIANQPDDETKPIFLGLVRDNNFLDGPEGVKWVSAKKARKIADQLVRAAEFVEAKNADTSVLDSDTPQGSSNTK